MTEPEIARILGIGRSTVQRDIRSGLAKLRSTLVALDDWLVRDPPPSLAQQCIDAAPEHDNEDTRAANRRRQRKHRRGA